MQNYTRRDFIKTSSLLGFAAAAGFMSKNVKDETTFSNWPLSFQAWEMRSTIVNDFSGTLKKLASVEYKGVEMCSPVGYGEIGFKPLQIYSAKVMKQIISDAGLFCKTCHHGGWEFYDEHFNKTIDFAKELGLEDLVVSAGIPKDSPLDEWKKVADDINKWGQKIKPTGLQLVYHNISMGPVFEGLPLYNHMMNMLDPDLVKMQLHIHEMEEGYSMIDYLKKYSGRYNSIHLFDWDGTEGKTVPLGHGIVDFKKLLTVAKNSGIKDYGLIVELELGNPFEKLKQSSEYFNNLKI